MKFLNNKFGQPVLLNISIHIKLHSELVINQFINENQMQVI